MYLSRLEILGFKSFAQKTVVNFSQGLTSIVGPNGCGKTNIVDAIRWSLGEQKSNTLRSDKMENVIFNGTNNRKPMGMSEVSLTIQNNKGLLPSEYTEVTITRRIFRSGESEYLLNKNICRLKDITNLFMDTGMGTNAYSVIELKMIETILSSKADERRTMFEEAAGVNKYKLRRRLALKKLDEVKSDLNRVNDIVSEVEKKVNSLERQAKKADKYNRVSTELRELELNLANHEFEMYRIKNDEAKAQKDDSFKERLIVESKIAELNDILKDIKVRLNETEQKLKSKRAEISKNTEKLYGVERNISVNEERKKSLSNNIDRYKQQLDELKFQLEENNELIEDNNLFIDDVVLKISVKEKERAELQEKADAIKNDFENKKAHLKALNDDLIEKYKELNNKENELKNYNSQLTKLDSNNNKLNEKIQQLTSNIAKTVGYLEDLNQEKVEIEKKIAEAESVYSQKQKEKEDLEKKLNSLKEKELEDKAFINTMMEKIGFIQTLIDNLEGISKGAKLLIENDDWTQGERTLIANIGNANDDYRTAIEAALKNNLNNIIVDSFEDVKNGIEYLKYKEAGKAAFYINHNEENKTLLQKVQNYYNNKKIKRLLKEPGVAGAAKDLIIADEKWKSFFDKFLAKTFIVENIETAFNLYKKYSDFNFTTLNGDYIDSSGIIEAGCMPKEDDTIFGRKQLLEKLKNEYPELEKGLSKLRDSIKVVEEEISQIDLKVLSEQGKIFVNDLANIEKQIAQIEFEKQKALDETEKSRKELQESATEYNIIDNKRTAVIETLDVIRVKNEEALNEKNNYEAEYKKSEDEHNELISTLNKVNISLERLIGEKKNSDNVIERAKSSVETIEKSINKHIEDIKNGEEEHEILLSILEEKQIEFDEIKETKEILAKEEAEIDNVYKAQKGEISKYEQEQNTYREQKENLSNSIHSAEMTLNEIKMKVDNLIENIKENYSIQLEHVELDDLETYDFKTNLEQVHQLKQQIKGLGPINLLAYSEYEEEKQRFDFLSKQRNDLIESEKDIIKTIEEINITAQNLFSETFGIIRENFIRIFRSLFNPGDEADLKLEENVDPLEAKIEIVAKPKGKRPTSIELLSGGEKTLTAIALLFSIYLVKPSPFCILDEIDAPLDDANIDRFTKIIKEFSKDTQFIVITHNKRTMEAADNLYGVTMQEEGISKLVGVRFNEDFSFVS